MTTADWASVPTAELLATITTCGLAVPPGLPEEIVRRGAETREPLCAIAADPASWEVEEGPRVWTPLFAIFLLGAIGDARSAPVLLEVLRTQDLGDWLCEAMAGILAWLGPAAIAALDAAARDETLDGFQRMVAATALYGIGCRAPETRAEVAARLAQIVRASDDPEFQGLVADAVARVDDAETQRALDAVFAEERIYTGMINHEDVQAIRAEPPWTLIPEVEDPMAFFHPDALAHLRRMEQERAERRSRLAEREAEDARRAARRDVHPEIARTGPSPVAEGTRTVRRSAPEVGRNDPCPCGSGKKFKKCCLGKV